MTEAVTAVQEAAPAEPFVDAPQDDPRSPFEAAWDAAGVVPVLQQVFPMASVTPARETSPAPQSIDASAPSQSIDEPRSSWSVDTPPPSRFVEVPPPSRLDESSLPLHSCDTPPPARFDDTPQLPRFSEASAATGLVDAPPPTRLGDAPPERARWPSEPAPDAAGGVVPLLQQVLAAMPAPPSDDVALFTRETTPASVVPAALDQLAVELGELVDAVRIGSSTRCTFDVDVPGLGRLEGRITIQAGQADVELCALRPVTAAALRARLQELQRMVDRESGGDVSLTIV